MIQIEHNGILIRCDTAEEAVKVAKLLAQIRSPSPVPSPSTEPNAVRKGKAISSELAGMYDAAVAFLRVADEHAGKELSSTDFANLFGLESPRGLGPFMAATKRRFEAVKLPVSLSQIVEKTGNPPGPILWSIKKAPRETNYSMLATALNEKKEAAAT